MVTTATQAGQETGLFPVSYQIGNEEPGAPVLTVHLVVDTPDERVSGFGRVTQATPFEMASKLEGDFTYMTVMPPSPSHILVTLTGYPIAHWPHGGGIGPVLLANLELRIVLSKDWKSGTANYKYRTEDANWHSVTNVPVKLIPSGTIQ